MDIEHKNFYDSIRAKGPRFQLPRNLQTEFTSTEIIHTFCNVLFEAWTTSKTKEFSYSIVSLDNFNSVFYKSWDMLLKHNKPPRKIRTFTIAFDNDNYITLKYSIGYNVERFLVLSESLVRLLAERYSKQHQESKVRKEPLKVSLKLSSLPAGLINKIKKNIDNPYQITYGPSAKQLFEIYLLPEIENPYMLLGHALKLTGIKDVVDRLQKSTKKPNDYYDNARGPLNVCCGLDSIYCGCYIIGDAYVPPVINYELVSIKFETAGDNYKVCFGKYAYDPVYRHVYKTGNLPKSLPSDESTRCRKMNIRNFINQYGSNEILEHPYVMALSPEKFRYWRLEQKIKFGEDENLSPIPVMRQENDFKMSLLDATIVDLNQEEIEAVFEHLYLLVIDHLIPLPEDVVPDVVDESDSETDIVDLNLDLNEDSELHINNEIDENDDESDWYKISENKKSVGVQTDSQMHFDNAKYEFPFKIECIIEVHRKINQPILDTTNFLYTENVNFKKLISTEIDERIRNTNVIRFQSPKCTAIALNDYSIGVLLEVCSEDTPPMQSLESVQIIGDSVQNKFAGLTGFQPFYFKKLQRSLITSIDDFPSTQVDKKKITSLFNETKARLHLDSLHTISILWISSKNLELLAIYWQKGTNELHLVLNKETSNRKYKINCMFFENSISSKKISNIKFGTMEALQMEISQTKKFIIKINPQNKPLLIMISDIYVWNKKLQETLQDLDVVKEVNNDKANENGTTERRHVPCRVLRKTATKPLNYYNENSNDFEETLKQQKQFISAKCNIVAEVIEDTIQPENSMESCGLRVMLEDFNNTVDGISDEIIHNKPQIKRSLPLQKKYAIGQQIAREIRSKYDKMFLKTDCSKIIPNPHTHFKIVNNKVRKVYVNGKPPLKRKIAGSPFKKRADNNVSQSTVTPQKSKELNERKLFHKNRLQSTPKTRILTNPKNLKTSFRTNRFYHSHNKISPKKPLFLPDSHDLYANSTPSRPQVVYDDLITNSGDEDPLAVEYIENSASENIPEQSECISSKKTPTDVFTEIVDGVITIRFNDNIFDVLEEDVTENRHNQHDKTILIDPESVETIVDENIADNVLSKNTEEGATIGSAVDTTMAFIPEDMINVNYDVLSTELMPSPLIANEPIPLSTGKDINPGEEYVMNDFSLKNVMLNHPKNDSVVMDTAPNSYVSGPQSAANNQINKKRKQQRAVYKKGTLKENLANYKATRKSLKNSSNETFNNFDTRNFELSLTASQNSPTRINNQLQIEPDVNFELTERDEVLRNDVQWMTCSPKKQHSTLPVTLLENYKEPELIDLTSEELEPLLEEPVFKRPKLFPRTDLFRDSNVNSVATEDIAEINRNFPNSSSWSSDPEPMLQPTHSNESILRPLLQETPLQTYYDSSQSFMPVRQTYMPNNSNCIQSNCANLLRSNSTNFVRNEFPPHPLLDQSVSALQHSSNLTNRMSTHDQHHLSFAPTVSNSRHNSRTRIAPTNLSNNTYARMMNVPGRYSTSLPRPRPIQPIRVIPKRPTNTGDSQKKNLLQFYTNLNSNRIDEVFLSSINWQNSKFRTNAAASNTYYPPLEYERFVSNPQFFSEIQRSPPLQSQPYARMVPYERIYPPTTFQECDTLRNRQLFNGERTYYHQFPPFNYEPFHRLQSDVFWNSNNKY